MELFKRPKTPLIHQILDLVPPWLLQNCISKHNSVCNSVSEAAKKIRGKPVKKILKMQDKINFAYYITFIPV